MGEGRSNPDSGEKDFQGSTSEKSCKIDAMLEDQLTQLSLYEGTLGFFEEVCREVFAKKRDYFVHRFTQHIASTQILSSSSSSVLAVEHEWTGIESLSRLRSVVGGRFQNLKKRWVNAGLPLKEHRGDQNLEYTLEEEGWVELTNWILKQGYEARLTDIQTGYLFELRPLGES